jgi:hypothetical protein
MNPENTIIMLSEISQTQKDKVVSCYLYVEYKTVKLIKAEDIMVDVRSQEERKI